MAKKPGIAFAQIAAVAPSKRGAKNPGLEHVQAFLHRFGYLAPASYSAGELDEPTSRALATFQRFQGLPTTGEFDDSTRAGMTIARCGLLDVHLGIEFATTCAWDRRGLTYAFDTGTNDIAGSDEFQAVRNAFQTWAGAVPHKR